MITTGICPKTFAPIYPHYKSFDSYIKPQLDSSGSKSMRVVYLLIPTSNHNCRDKLKAIAGLYIFWFLHQTTTTSIFVCLDTRCISFDSYIKPQLDKEELNGYCVVYLLIPTSNHNRICETLFPILLYIFWFLHQTTTRSRLQSHLHCCISFDSYIKPQLLANLLIILIVVYLLIPTSNHNSVNVCRLKVLLYFFWFLHQTTTNSLFAHLVASCISFDSYIKPQLLDARYCAYSVVYLLIPTSNHNWLLKLIHDLQVVYLLIPTSNHNFIGTL